MRGRGGYIGFNRVPAASALNSSASGVWTLQEQESLKRAGTWPFSFVNPASITGLQLWLDAADSATLFDATSGGSLVAADGGVARWEDKSGNARHATQSTSANRPARKTAVQGGKDVLRFDGSNDFLEGFSTPAGGNTRSVFAVAKLNTSFGEMFQIGKGTGNGFLIRAGASSGVAFVGGDISTNNLTIPSTTLPVATTFLAALIQQSTTQITYYHNTTNYSITGTLSDFDMPNAGYFVGKARNEPIDFTPWTGDIAEIIVYNTALSNTNRALVETYLMSKWGIT